MDHLILEIKAKCEHPRRAVELLRDWGARAVGCDHQTDTYFLCKNGRLKLRQGNIENTLISYSRPNQTETKESRVRLFPVDGSEQCATLGSVLASALETLVVVRKRREIFFLDNVKFHVDSVDSLGSFLEIEAIGKPEERDVLQRQCDEYQARLGISPDDRIACSYSDLLLDRATHPVATISESDSRSAGKASASQRAR